MSEALSMLTPLVAILREPGRRCDDEDESHGALDGSVLNGMRWMATDGLKPSQLTLYYVSSDIALRTDEDSEQKMLQKLSNGEGQAQLCKPLLSSTHTSTTSEQLPGKHLLAVWVGVQKGMEGAFVDWYEGEHMPMLEEIPGWLCGRLYSIVDDCSQGERPKETEDVQFLAVHRFLKEGFMESKELKASQNTPWLTKVMENITSKDLRLFELDVLYDRVGKGA